MAKKPGRADLRGADADVLQIVALQSRDPSRIRRVLDPRNPLGAALLPHVIPLLDERAVAGIAMTCLQPVADKHGGALIDALLDPSRSPTVRRRLARVLSACQSPVVVDGLLMALEDSRADVRAQSARSLSRISRRVGDLRLDADRMLDLVRVELARDVPDLRHAFTLLSFVIPVEPLRAAYRALRGDDNHVRGTALEYLHGVLPKDIRVALLARL